ncbi:hypothetical protein PAI11_16690 [Patulibacter medicamentivorans]|jgi:hypothetical protein|uniref:Uncharacterized protein n=1 Tax=Patulibacter medicamentivorans TaxID=1097667 RepID=H0E4D9_9ACTN|nr:hypothetical protein [Patulibacter medicamentivorans]EHN11463.1 hypothetical protein PAI11_16690 [Patulibacter medicamentivorans]
MGSAVTTKKKCCKSRPRCKKCPVVWKRLEAEDLAERLGKREYRPLGPVPKKVLKDVRR